MAPKAPATSLNDDLDHLLANKKIPNFESRDHSTASRFIVDPEGPATHDDTTVDIITVPCPGGHPLKTWNRDGLISRFFGAPSMRDAEVENTDGSPAPSWVRQGIRRQANRARVLLYQHPETSGDSNLSSLADSLLQTLRSKRKEDSSERPIFIISHSIGGLVAKMALVKAARDTRYSSIIRDCYGIAFFGTPHQGSSYFAMPGLSLGIQKLLQLGQPLSTAITDDLRVGNELLIHLDDDFKAISTDLKIWTFYETIDSRLGSAEAYFTAPLTSIKSAILGMRQERIMPLQSDHANIASFGRHNVSTLDLFLQQLAFQIDRADKNTRAAASRDALNLDQRVSVEVHGFFQDPVGPATSETAIIRAWSTRLPLKDFLIKGPDGCLGDRLNEVQSPPEPEQFLKTRGRTSVIHDQTNQKRGKGKIDLAKNPLGIQNIQPTDEGSPPDSPMLRPTDARPKARTESAPIIPRQTSLSPKRPLSSFTHHSTPMQRPSPLIRADFDQDLAIDRLSPLIHATEMRSFSRAQSNGSGTEYRDFPPFSQRRPSNPDTILSDDDEEAIDDSVQLPEAIVPIKKTIKGGKGGKDETVVVVDQVIVAFKKPEVDSRKFTWIHLPFNNPTWVKKIFESIQLSCQTDYATLYNSDFWATKHTRGRHSQHYAFHAKPGCYYTGGRSLTSRAQSMRSRTASPHGIGDGMSTCVFLPYLHFDTYKRLVRRREVTLQRLLHGRAHPVPEAVAKSDTVEHQVLWEFLGHDPPINLRRTLDQYRYPSLRDTRSRDDDQMLYKLTKEREGVPGHSRDFYAQGSSGRPPSHTGSWRKNVVEAGQKTASEDGSGPPVLNGNVLMVDQLWLWVLGSHTLLTCFPKRQSDPIEGPLYQQADLRESIFHEVNVDVTRQCENAFDLAALSVLHAVSVLLDRSSHPDLEVFRIFEEAISVLTEKLTSSLKAFRTEGFRDKAFDYEPVENKERSIRARHKAEGRRAEAENRDNTSALLELRDIEDELLILLHLFEQQTKVVSSMDATFTRPELRDQTINARVFLNEALKKLGEYIGQAEEMIARVRGTRDDYDKLLQMVQRQAQVDEVRLSRLHADLASAQSRSVLIFTTFTVIFLPLTFFTGLFGMNTQEWGGEGNLSLKTIGAISLPSSFALIVFSLVIAWSTNVRKLFRWLGQVWSKWMRQLYFEVWRPFMVLTWGNKTKKTAARRKTEEAERRLKKEASDFWERHRLERERGYQIPAVNMKDNARPGSGGKGKKDVRTK